MELLVHLNKRIKSRPKIQLPVETLLVQYQDPAAASFVTVSFSVYVQFSGGLMEEDLKNCLLACPVYDIAESFRSQLIFSD